MNEVGLIAGPRFRRVGFTASLPIEVREDSETIAVLCPQELHVFVKCRAECAIEADAERDVFGDPSTRRTHRAAADLAAF